jgi:hypothetical protein
LSPPGNGLDYDANLSVGGQNPSFFYAFKQLGATEFRALAVCKGGVPGEKCGGTTLNVISIDEEGEVSRCGDFGDDTGVVCQL